MKYFVLCLVIFTIFVLNSCNANDLQQPTDAIISTSDIEIPNEETTLITPKTGTEIVSIVPDTSLEIETAFSVPVVDVKPDTETLLLQNLHEIIQMTKSKFWQSTIILAENVSQVKSAIAGDLNRDGNDDLVVVIEFAIKNENDKTKPDYMFNWGSPRTIYILLGNSDGSYTIAHKNESLILENGMGGRFGEPLESLKIEDGVLNIGQIQGTSWSWINAMRFSYDNNGRLVLISVMQDCYWSVGPNNETTICDFVNDKIERYSWSHPWEEDSEKLLLYNGELPSQTFLFDNVTYNEIDNFCYIKFLPYWENYRYDGFQEQSYTPYELKITPSQALDMVMAENYPDFEKVNIAYTQENKDNYFKLLFYETPDYYYRGENGVLIYRDVENTYPNKLQHRIYYYPFYDNAIKDNSIVIEDK